MFSLDQQLPSVVEVEKSSCRQRLTENLQTLCKTLKATFRSKHFFQRAAGPHVGKVEFINLALVKKQRVSEDEKERDAFLKKTLHGSIDDIIKKKVKINLEDIFNFEGEELGRKVVLVEGAPGVGKTMLAMKLCVAWANGQVLTEYDLVILVQLRRFQACSHICLEDLLQISLDKSEIAKQASNDLLKCNNKVLFILEGWDELPPMLRKETTFFFDMITADKLPNASVMVTSRPSVTAPLYDYMDERHIEVLGFSSEQIEEYVKKHTCDTLKADLVLDHLKRFPNVQALAHIPLTLAIICSLIKNRSDLPPTLTELYECHVCNTLLPKLKNQLPGIKSMNDLDKATGDVVKTLGNLALDGFKEKAFVFRREHLLQIGLGQQEEFDGYGLLSTIQVSTTAGYDCFYQFRHLSIQEFLAAYHMKQLSDDDRLEILKEFQNDRQFQNIWKFLAGITRLQDEPLRNWIISKTNQSNRAQLFLLHCLYEAHDPYICQVAATKVKHKINLTNISLNTTDCLCAAYAITGAGGVWEVNLRGANIGEEGLEVFKSHFLYHIQLPESERTDIRIKKLE